MSFTDKPLPVPQGLRDLCNYVEPKPPTIEEYRAAASRIAGHHPFAVAPYQCPFCYAVPMLTHDGGMEFSHHDGCAWVRMMDLVKREPVK